MQNDRFNESEFQYILDYINKDLTFAIKLFNDYLKRYPSDFYARAYYIILLERINKYDLAGKEFREIAKLSQHDYYYRSKFKRQNDFQSIMALAKVKLLANKGNYQRLLDYYNKNINSFSNTETRQIILYYCKVKLGLINKNNARLGPYLFMQSLDYQENRFMEHITRHLYSYNTNIEKPNTNIFLPDFPITEVIDEVKKYIPSDKKTCPGIFDDAYCFKYDRCGKVRGEIVNYFKVICFQNTNQLLTMYPVKEIDYILTKDLNDLENENNKTKKLSKLD